jgi:hypothetical protein
MARIPVGATIAHAYRFAFGRFADVLRSVWIALALQLTLSLFAIRSVITVMGGVIARDPSVVSHLWPFLVLYPLILILFLAQVAAVTDLALGRGPVGWFHMRIGKPVWRLVGAFVLAAVAVAVAFIALLLALMLAGFLIRLAGLPRIATGLIGAGLFVIGYCGLIFVSFRLFFLLVPTVMIQQRLSLAPAWRLTKGNFWRIVVVVLAILLPVVAIEYAIMFGVGGLPPSLPHANSPEAAAAFERVRLAWQIDFLSLLLRNWFLTLPVLGLIHIVFLGVGCSASVFAWRALTDGETQPDPQAQQAIPG